jgi:hypothetical protein
VLTLVLFVCLFGGRVDDLIYAFNVTCLRQMEEEQRMHLVVIDVQRVALRKEAQELEAAKCVGCCELRPRVCHVVPSRVCAQQQCVPCVLPMTCLLIVGPSERCFVWYLSFAGASRRMRCWADPEVASAPAPPMPPLNQTPGPGLGPCLGPCLGPGHGVAGLAAALWLLPSSATWTTRCPGYHPLVCVAMTNVGMATANDLGHSALCW